MVNDLGEILTKTILIVTEFHSVCKLACWSTYRYVLLYHAIITHECQQYIYIVNVYLMKVFYFLAIISFSHASRLSLGIRVYTHPVTVLGSTLVKMSLKGMLRMSGMWISERL